MLQSSDIRLLAVALALFANAYAMSNPFPYAPFMVLSFGVVSDTRETGFFAGWIMSSFMAGRAVSSYPLGILSDKWGRRPVVELGLWSCVVFQLGFGLSPGLAFALSCRFLMGAFNGILGVSKAWLPDIAPPDKQPLAMSLVAGTWGMGQVIGPSLGGLLTAATERDAFPFVWPNVVGAALAIVSVAAIRALLPANSRSRLEAPREASSRALAGADSAAEASESVTKVPTPSTRPVRRCLPRCGFCSSVPRTSAFPLAIYCCVSFVTISFGEAYPLLLLAPVDAGGLGWKTAEIGALLATGGVVLALTNFVLYPWLARRHSATTLFTAGLFALSPLYAMAPFLVHALASRPSLLWPALVAHNGLLQLCATIPFTSIFLIINASCAKEQRGRVNGLGMTLSSLFKAVGPVSDPKTRGALE